MTPIGLAASKTAMDTKFNLLTKKGTAQVPDAGGAIYKAAYHAYYDKIAEFIGDDPTDPDILSTLSQQGKLKVNNIKNLQNDAHEFASLFADAMKECLDEVSNQIDSHIKSMIINITTPVPNPTTGTTLIAGSIPVTGSVVMTNTLSTGGITVS